MPTPTTPTLWHVPYQRNPYFTGREDVLAQLHHALRTDATVALSHPQGISGLGGIGKTQTALEYTYRYRTEYKAVFWVRADSATSLTSSLIELAHLLELPERNEKDQETIVQAVLRWLRLHPDWLLIYDSIDDLSLAEPFLPKSGLGHLLFTTRAHALGGLAQRLDIEKMQPEIGALLLLRRADMIALEALLDMANSNDQSIARAISEELDGLPLALDQAGAYIKEAPCPLPDYLSRYQSRRSEILRTRGQSHQDYPASVATTWSLSFEKVSQSSTAAAELLNFCAFLAPDAIPEAMLTEGVAHLPPHLQDAIVHPVRFDRTTAALLAYSLLRRDANGMLSLHRLVQAVLRDTMNEEMRSQWAKSVLLVVNTVFPERVGFTTWSQCELYLPHAFVCADLVEQERMSAQEAARLFYGVGQYLIERARPGEAYPLLQQALSIIERHLGSEHTDAANVIDRIARCLKDQGKYEQALPLLKRALSIYEHQLGGSHPSTAVSLNNLALLYYAQGKYEEALPLYERALEIDEKTYGVEHPEVATDLNNLARLYYERGRFEDVLLLLKRALSIREKQLGTSHPDTATSLNDLANLYWRQERYGEAEPLYRRVLAIYEQQLGTEHPWTATGLTNLGTLYYKEGKYAEAEQLLQRALAVRERTQEKMHPDIAQGCWWLAVVCEQEQQYEKAASLYQRAFSIFERVLGQDHPNTQKVGQHYASLLRMLGRDEEAILIEERDHLSS